MERLGWDTLNVRGCSEEGGYPKISVSSTGLTRESWERINWVPVMQEGPNPRLLLRNLSHHLSIKSQSSKKPTLMHW